MLIRPTARCRIWTRTARALIGPNANVLSVQPASHRTNDRRDIARTGTALIRPSTNVLRVELAANGVVGAGAALLLCRDRLLGHAVRRLRGSPLSHVGRAQLLLARRTVHRVRTVPPAERLAVAATRRNRRVVRTARSRAIGRG
ncbi:hypothetical protein [Lentzea atacamensis]|uniref:hypothetical protein n=1 Tax=Lentzea atacamensis TaxID=531938 RepID=UPI000D6C52EC|nr:hypothetical protein [Lentzea atacamensis]